MPTIPPTDTLGNDEARTSTVAVSVLLLTLAAIAGIAARLLARPDGGS